MNSQSEKTNKEMWSVKAKEYLRQGELLDIRIQQKKSYA
nr:MAG TPA: hypothetical protein [Caudoviricetes sp.]